MSKQPARRPPVVDRYWYSIDWDVAAIWALDLPVQTMPIGLLAWQLDVPLWPDRGKGYRVSPNQVTADPDRFAAEFERVERADMTFPIDITHHKGRWMILDGVHRLARAVMAGDTDIRVRKVPPSAVRQL